MATEYKTTVIKQLSKTLELLENELKRSEPSDERLEFFYNKITILEAYI